MKIKQNEKFTFINKDSIAETKGNNTIKSFSEVLFNQNLIADAETKDDMATIVMQFIMIALIVLQSDSSIIALL